MKTFQLYSAQTGDKFGRVMADNEAHALDLFAQRNGFENAPAMWSAGRWEYIIVYPTTWDVPT